MRDSNSLLWFRTISVILVIVGLIFSVFGLNILPVVNKQVVVHWVSSIYGAVLVGWGITLFLIGSYAYNTKNYKLLEYLLYGLFSWLLIEAIFSLYLGVYFNVGVDIAVCILFSFPIIFTLLRKNPIAIET